MPDDLFYEPLISLEILLANCAEFQTQTGTGTPAAARAFIHNYSAFPREVDPMPRAIVGAEPGRVLTKVSSGGWEMSGPMLFEFQRESDGGDVGDHRAGAAVFGPIMDNIIDEMKVLSGSDGFLNVTAFAEVGTPTVFAAEHADGVEYWGAVYEVQYLG